MDPASGIAAATLTEEAPSQSQLLPSVRRLAIRLRGAFGETKTALDNARNELEHVPIPTLKALSLHAKAFTLGGVRDSLTPVQARERWAGVERLVRESLDQDPTYAHAWIMLAWALRNQNRPQADYLPYARRAFYLAETATPQERYFILGSFHEMNIVTDLGFRATGNSKELEQSLSAYEALFTLQPDHYYVQNNLRMAYRQLGRDHEAALIQIRQADVQTKKCPPQSRGCGGARRRRKSGTGAAIRSARRGGGAARREGSNS